MSGASMPLGMDLSPDMLRSMTDTVAAMDPQDMERMLGAMGTGSPAPPCVPAAAPGTALPGTAGASSLAGAQVLPHPAVQWGGINGLDIPGQGRTVLTNACYCLGQCVLCMF